MKLGIGTGGASAVKEPGHFEVRKSSSQVTQSQGRSQDFTLGVSETECRGGA